MVHGIRAMTVIELLRALKKAGEQNADATCAAVQRELSRREGRPVHLVEKAA